MDHMEVIKELTATSCFDKLVGSYTQWKSRCFSLCVFSVVSTPTRVPRWLMGISWRAVSFMWLLEEKGLGGCPTVTCSSPNPEEQGELMGED